MSYADRIFVENCEEIIQHGISDEAFNVRPKWPDGTPAHTKKILYVQNRYQLTKSSIPVMTLRKSGFKNAIDEILWIYQKKSNRIEDLHSHIWDSWDVGDGTIGKAYGYQIAQESKHHIYHPGEDLDGIQFRIEPDDNDVDWVYLSQIDAVLWDLKNNPGSRSIMTNTYVHHDLADMGLRPCAYSMTFNVIKNDKGQMVLNGMLNQRSQDMLTANNWNVIQYSVLLQMLAQVTGMIPGVFVHTVADMHIYDRHIPLVQEMIKRYHLLVDDAAICAVKRSDVGRGLAYKKYIDEICETELYPTPTFWINPDVKNFYDFTVDDFRLENYFYEEFNHKIEVAI